jgi:hypothetical protein
MISWVALVVIKVRLGVVVSVVMADVSTSVVVTVPSELVGVRVEVETMIVVDGGVVCVVVMVDDSVTTGGVVVGVEVGVDVGVDVVSSEVVSLLVPPVDKLTLCRLKSAIASSKGSAEAAEANSKPAKRT